MKANIFCNVCKKPLRAVKEWGKNEVDVYVIPCENCAAQQSVQPTGGTCPAPQSDTLADEFPALWDSRTPPTIG